MVPIIDGVLDIGSKLIDKFFPDPEAKRKAKMQLMEMQQAGELKELETRFSAITAEANSKDPWTSRARPTFMYVFYVVIVFLVVIAPLVGVFFPSQMELFFENVSKGFKAIPGELWATFTAGYLGYGGLRTIEKAKKVSK